MNENNSNNTRLSIIIPTFGRSVEVDDLLTSIEQTEIPLSYEIIIVDQNTDGKIDSIVERHRSKLEINHHKIKSRGLSKARNYGIRCANGDIICFPDDDAQFTENTIKNALSTLEETCADCVSGKLVEKETGMDAMILFPQNRKILTISNMEDSFIEPAMFYKKEFLEYYQYDENMGVGTIHGAQEGYDQVFRALKDGKKIVYDPRIIYYHPMKKGKRTTEGEIHRAFYYSCGLGYLCKKHKLDRKFRNRFIKLSVAIPYVAIFRNKEFKYFFAQWMGILLGYKYI